MISFYLSEMNVKKKQVSEKQIYFVLCRYTFYFNDFTTNKRVSKNQKLNINTKLQI